VGQGRPADGAGRPRARACSTASWRRCAPSLSYRRRIGSSIQRPLERAWRRPRRQARRRRSPGGDRLDQERLDIPEMGVLKRSRPVDDGREYGGRRPRVVLCQAQRCLADAYLAALPFRLVHVGEDLLDAPGFADAGELLQQVRAQPRGVRVRCAVCGARRTAVRRSGTRAGRRRDDRIRNRQAGDPQIGSADLLCQGGAVRQVPVRLIEARRPPLTVKREAVDASAPLRPLARFVTCSKTITAMPPPLTPGPPAPARPTVRSRCGRRRRRPPRR
jgi:hypothetical protein